MARLGIGEGRPNPKRLHELEQILGRLPGILDGTEIDRFRRRGNARQDLAGTVDFADQVLRHLAKSDMVRLLEAPDQAALDAVKAMCPNVLVGPRGKVKLVRGWNVWDLDLVKRVVRKAVELNKAGRLDTRCPFRETAIAVAAQFLDLPVHRIRLLLH